MGNSFDVIVVGVGAMGASACWHLAKRGQRVLGIERFDIAHPHGSSGGQTRLVRLAYYEHPDYVPLLRRAYANWDAIGAESSENLLHRTGGLYVGRPDRPFIDGSRRAADEHGLAYEMLDPPEITKRFPPFAVPEHFVGMFEHEAGFVYSERAIATFAQQATAHGATICANERVIDWAVDASGVAVETDKDRYVAGRLVFAAGAWSASVVAAIAPLLTVTRQVLGWVTPPEPAPFALGRFPCWGIEDDAPGFEGIYYGFPMADPRDGLKVAHHAAGPATSPDELDRETHDADADDYRPALTKYLPGAVGPTKRMHVCMYTCSPDHHFIIDTHPAHANVIVATGFSGHGFKFASVVGEALADLAVDGRTELPIGFLGLDRFAGYSG